MVPRFTVVLASASPRRQLLLRKILDDFEVFAPNLDESSETLPLEERSKELAMRKALFVNRDDALVIGSDTIVGLDNQALGKPENAEDARATLAILSGRTHVVITGVALVWPGGSHAFADTTNVTFRELSQAEITAYVDTGEPMDKAGSYAIQGGAVGFAGQVDGDIDTVIGLPVAALACALETHELAR